MYLLLSIVAALIAIAKWGAPIGDVPFAQLTLDLVFARIFSCAAAAGAVWALFQTFAKDRIWPWRWTIPYIGNLFVRACACAAIIAFAVFLSEKKPVSLVPTWIVAIAAAGFVLYALFTRELDVFDEKKSAKGEAANSPVPPPESD